MELTLFTITDNLSIYFKTDTLGILFACLFSIIFICIAIYSRDYFHSKSHRKMFYIFLAIAWMIYMLISFAGNIVTFYVCFEFLTLSTFPMVIIDRTRESILAALKYLFYSLAGAYCALFGLFFLCKYTDSLEFTPGGVLSAGAVSEHQSLLLVCAFLMIVGFGVKAGMFPMHAWLPTAHPVAPSPASALLSGVIVKAGILAMIRVVFEIFGVSFLAGTWVQYTVLILAMITILMGSMVALGEQRLKKRLAYSTVSQLSYIIFGIFLFNQTAFAGAMLQLVSHALCKSVLFLCAGAYLVRGIEYVSDLNGIGYRMRMTTWCFIIASLGLIGIPPTLGAFAKWNLGTGSFASGIPYVSYIGPIILIISALLTAGYLMPIATRAFFKVGPESEKCMGAKEVSRRMTLPMAFMAVLSIIVGILPTALQYMIDKMSVFF